MRICDIRGEKSRRRHHTRSEWVSRGLTSHSTLYRSFRWRFLQVTWPNRQRQSTEGSQLATEISSIPPEPLHRVTMWTVGKATASRLITACGFQCDKKPICWTYKLSRTSRKSIIVTRAAVSMFPLYSRPSSDVLINEYLFIYLFIYHQ